MRSLYDVNCLLALLDRHHAAHETVAAWFAANTEHGWASCPLTQNGCIRILSQPGYPHPLSVVETMDLLRAVVASEQHQFIHDDISLLDVALVDDHRMSGHRQVTDVYLLALAVTHNIRLVTQDTSIPLDAVHGANENHLVLI